MTATPDRVLTGAQLRAARDWLTWVVPRGLEVALPDCAPRVLAVLVQLLADDDGWVDPADLSAAATEPDTVECALALLADAGLPCA